MKLTPENPSKAPGHTCPVIDQIKSKLRLLKKDGNSESVRLTLISECLEHLEDLREANERLRHLASIQSDDPVTSKASG